MSILMQIYNFFKTIQLCISWWKKKTLIIIKMNGMYLKKKVK